MSIGSPPEDRITPQADIIGDSKKIESRQTHEKGSLSAPFFTHIKYRFTYFDDFGKSVKIKLKKIIDKLKKI